MPLEDASEGWLEPLGHLLWEVLEGKGLILFASMSQNHMKEMTQNNETLVTEFHKTEEMTGPWRQSRRTKLSEQIEEIQRGKHKISQGYFPLFFLFFAHKPEDMVGLLPASRARSTRGCRHVMQTVQGWAPCAAISKLCLPLRLVQKH